MERIKAKTGSEIARELDISRQAVSQTLKRAVTKIYKGLQEEGITDSPTETILFMRDWLNVTDEEDLQQFYDMFPKNIREEIKEHARTYTIGEYRDSIH
jgi:predicted transcriptional regulator